MGNVHKGQLLHPGVGRNFLETCDQVVGSRRDKLKSANLTAHPVFHCQKWSKNANLDVLQSWYDMFSWYQR